MDQTKSLFTVFVFIILLWFYLLVRPKENDTKNISSSSSFITKKETIEKGYSFMKEKKVLICGITRDNASTLPLTLKWIDHICSLFKESCVIIYENDSKDNTCSIIREWISKRNPSNSSSSSQKRGSKRKKIENLLLVNTNKSKVVFISEKLQWSAASSTGGFSKGRFQKLSYCRNKYLQEIRKEEYEDYEYVINIDMDLWEGPLEGIAHSFGLAQEWDMVAANGVANRTTYYDSLAFRNQEFPDTLNHMSQLAGAQKKYTADMPLVPVHSAFGGMAIYKRKCLLTCNYSGEDCEHVLLHSCLKKDSSCSRLFVNPAMFLYYPF